MTQALLGIGLLAVGVLLWRLTEAVAGTAFSRYVQRKGSSNGTPYRRMRFVNKLIALGLMGAGGWMLIVSLQAIPPETAARVSGAAFIGSLLVTALGGVLVLLFYKEASKRPSPEYFKPRSLKGHVGWLLMVVGTICAVYFHIL